MAIRSAFGDLSPRAPRRSGAASGPRAAAFTLLELLVVVAIITLLMGVLLPSLAAAREQAQRVSCSNNIKRLASGMIIYAQEWERLPSANWGAFNNTGDDVTWPGSSQIIGGWLYTAPCTVVPGNTALNLKNIQSGKLWPIMKNYRLYRCPIDRGPWDPSYQVQWFDSYTVNGAVNGYGQNIPKKWTYFASNAILIWETDDSRNIWNDGANFPGEGITRRHGKGATVGRFDGGGEYIKGTAFDAEAQKMPGRLWCNPDAPNGY